MALYLCGTAALDVMRYLRSTNGGEIPGTPARPRRLGNALNSDRQLNELGESAQRLLSHVQGKVEVLVPRRRQHTRTSRLETHLWTHDIPRGAFIDLGNGIYLSSPAFLFVQLASKLGEVELIMLGLELCGSYSLWRLPAPSFGPSQGDLRTEATYELSPALTAARLKSFIIRMDGERGVVRARNAAKYVLDNDASPMESAVYLLLCLPRHLGGRGLPKPLFNVKVNVTTSTTTTSRYPDLYWPTRALDVEYQSDQDHSGDWARYRDARRQVELEAENVTVLPLTRHQVMDADEFNAFATSVRRMLGVRSRPLPRDWERRYLKLRTVVLGTW